MDYIGLLDSGADISAIHISIAEILGLGLSAQETFSFGIGGKVRSKDSRIKIRLSKGHESYDMTIPVKVIIDDYDFGVMLLGRKGFFDRFIIKFDENGGKITLKKLERQNR